MQRHRATVKCLGLIVALAAVWSTVDGSGSRAGDPYFVFDPAAGRGYIAIVEPGGSCPLSGMPVALPPARRAAGCAARSGCAASAGAASRSCGARASSCFCFPLGHMALHTVNPLVVADDGPAHGRLEGWCRSAPSRLIRPPVPPPRTA